MKIDSNKNKLDRLIDVLQSFDDTRIRLTYSGNNVGIQVFIGVNIIPYFFEEFEPDDSGSYIAINHSLGEPYMKVCNGEIELVFYFSSMSVELDY